MAKKEETKKKTTKKVETKKDVKKVKKEVKEVKEVKIEKTEKKDRGLLFAIIGIVLVVAIAVISMVIPERDKESEGPDSVLAVMTIKNYGDIILELDRKTAPITVDNFIELANSGFYDGLTFHRIIKGFMIQGGGNPDVASKTIKGEFTANGVENNISHTRGTISMARANSMDSASTQFFIVQEDSTHLDGNYASFGKVISGMEIIDKVIDDFGTENDETLPEGKRPIIEGIRSIEIEESTTEE